MSAPPARRLALLYAVTVFVSSAVLLVLEITAARLMAPYVGVSLYSWTAIIGVILAGLSLGNWLGGRWADRGGGNGAAGGVLAAAALTTLAVLLALTFVAPRLLASDLGLLASSLVYATLLFAVPAVLLGVVSPLVTTLALALDSRTGRIVGRMHALAALGSIIGAFATGFWLVQYFGTRHIIVGCAAVLGLLSVPYLARARAAAVPVVLLAGAMVAAATVAKRGFENPCTVESQYYCIRVEPAPDMVPFGEARAMVLDHLLHGVNHATEPGMLVSPYLHATDELVLGYLAERAATARYLFLGGGAYTHPRAVTALAPGADVTVVEIDPAVTRVAGDSLFVPLESMRVMHDDARVALHRLGGERFDAIVGDVFQDVAMPYHLLTREFAGLVARRLNEGGVYLLNVVDAHPAPRLLASLVRTLEAEFDHVHAWTEELPDEPQRLTYVVSASNAGEPPPFLVAQRGFERRWTRVTEHLIASVGGRDRVPILTDERVPVERLASRLLTTGLGR